MGTTHSTTHQERSSASAVDALATARADLAKATTAAKLATAKRGRLAAVVRALEAEAEAERYRLQGQADRERAVRAEATLMQERAAHLAEERAHAAELERLKPASTQKRAAAPKVPANGQKPRTLIAAQEIVPGPAEPDKTPGRDAVRAAP